MRRYWNGLLSLVLMGVLFYTLIQINGNSPRVNADAFSAGDIPEGRLVLLEGGEVTTDVEGYVSRRFTLRWEGGGCLFMPKAGGNLLLVNGKEWDSLENGKRRLFQFADAASPDHVYEVELRSVRGTLDRHNGCIYLGPLSAVSACITSQTVSRYMVTGICFCILLFSLVLYAWKRSETYLFWLALYALLMLARTQDALGFGLILRADDPLFQMLERFVSERDIFQIIYHLLAAYLNYQVLRSFLSAKLFGRSIMFYIIGAQLLQIMGDWYLGGQFLMGLLYHGVLFTCQIICIEKDRELASIERNILSAAWVLTVVFQVFFNLGTYGSIPYGDVSLQIHIPPLITCIYPTAFFIVACRRFAMKFQEADDLNTHLEALAREKTKEQTAFIRSMLHNLKTPLFSLVGYTDMAMESMAADPASAGRYLTKVSDKAQYVSGMLDHLFLLTQMDANQMVFQRGPVRLEELLRAVEESARLKGKEKDIQVSLTAPQDAFCTGDPLYLQQAFQNIADNAVEHVEAGGHLDISVAGDGDAWAVTFADDGCGIAPQDLPRIFDRYYSNHHGKRGSSGLGLAIAKEIVEHHGGSIQAESAPGRGAVFTVALPKLTGEPPQS